jgi:methenyltetrahydrofolate cyclohydrolase
MTDPDRSFATYGVGEWLDALGSDAPTPGGGAVAGLVAASGAAMLAMVGRLTIGKQAFADVEPRMRELVATADRARASFLEMADRDAHAFDGVMRAFRMPKETDEERTARSAAIQDGYAAAAMVPLEMARHAVDLMPLAEEATATGNPQASSDGYVGAIALHAASRAAIANVEINAAALKDETRRAELLDACAILRSRGEDLLSRTETAFGLRLGS